MAKFQYIVESYKAPNTFTYTAVAASNAEFAISKAKAQLRREFGDKHGYVVTAVNRKSGI